VTTPGGLALSDGLWALAILGAIWILSRTQGFDWLDYGWRGAHRGLLLTCGAASGLVLMSLLMAALVLAHGAAVDVGVRDLGTAIASGSAWAAAFAVLALAEEGTFRGFPFLRAAERFGPRAAFVLTSLFFGGAHLGNQGENAIGLAQVVAFGLVCCLAVWRTGSLWWVLGFHAAWDWCESFLFGTADSGRLAAGHLLTTRAIGPAWLSGGSVGPEGSVLVFPVLGLAALLVVFALPRGAERAPWRAARPREPDAGA
jgi:hypothetical protein